MEKVVKNNEYNLQKDTKEGTGAAGGASTGAFEGPFFKKEEETKEGLNLQKKRKGPRSVVGAGVWHDIYDKIHDLGLTTKELVDVCEHYNVSPMQAFDDDFGYDYQATLENLVDFFKQEPGKLDKFLSTTNPEIPVNEFNEIVSEELSKLTSPDGGFILTNKDLESEMDESTSIASVGAGGHGSGFAYIDPYGKGYHKEKNWGTWAKNEESMIHNQKPWWPGGSFVTVKKKCQKFPYCNQGDINALNLSNPKVGKSHALSEGLNIPKKLYNSEQIEEKIKGAAPKYGLSLSDIQFDGDKAYAIFTSEAFGGEFSSNVCSYINDIAAVILAKHWDFSDTMRVTFYFDHNPEDLLENKDIYNKNKPVMGTARKLKEYEDKLFKTVLKESIFDEELNVQSDDGIDNTPDNEKYMIYRDDLDTLGEYESGLEINEKDDKWIQKAVDPDHEGYCTPMTKKTCTPHRKALAKRFKKMGKERTDESTLKENMFPENESVIQSVADATNGKMKVVGKIKQWGSGTTTASVTFGDDTTIYTMTDLGGGKVKVQSNRGPGHESQFANFNGTTQDLISAVNGVQNTESINEIIRSEVKKIVEEKTPGISLYNKIHDESGTSNRKGVKDMMDNAARLNKVDDKTENQKLSDIGNGEPKYGNFDKDKVKREKDIIDTLRGWGLEDLNYDTEPSEGFKKRAEEALTGSARMGNDPKWANAMKDFNGNPGTAGEDLLKKAEAKKEILDKRDKDPKINIKYKDPQRGEIKLASEGTMKNLKTQRIIYYQKDIDNLIPESHKVDGAKFKLTDGKSTIYDLKWEGGALVVENEQNEKVEKVEINESKRLMNYGLGSYQTKFKPKLTEEKK